MNLLENVQLALRGLAANKLRAFLTIKCEKYHSLELGYPLHRSSIFRQIKDKSTQVIIL
jgi:hypothetical protein